MCSNSVLQRLDLKKLRNYQYVCFAGGAVRGISMCSAFCEVVEIYRREFGGDFIRRLKGTGGTSIGACLAMAILCELPVYMLERLATDHSLFDADSLLKNLDFKRFWEEGGLLDHNVLYEKIDKLFDLLKLPVDIDFITLYKKTRKLFVCNTCDLEGKEVVYMSYKTHPYRRVRDALCMSMCLPLLFVGFEYDGVELCDGGIYANYIVNQFPEGQVLGFAIDDRPSRRDRNVKLNGFEKAMSLVKNLCHKIDRQNLALLSPEYRESTVMIYTPGFGQVKVYANKAEASMLWEYGKMSVIWHFFKYVFVYWLLCRYISSFLCSL